MHKILHELHLTYKITKVETLYLEDVDQHATSLDPQASRNLTLLQEAHSSSMSTKKHEIPPKAQKPLKWGLGFVSRV